MLHASRRLPLLPALILCLVASAGTSFAQQAEAPEQEYDRLFQIGLRAIGERDLNLSERIFKRCIQLFPDRPVSYYNLACTYSLMGKAPEAVAQLRASFERGFQDVAHMQRDMDLEKIRRTPVFRKAISDFEEQILGEFDQPLTHVPQGGSNPVLVWIHDQQAKPTSDLQALREAFPDWAIVLPLGKKDEKTNSHVWDGRNEFVISHGLRNFLRDQAEHVDRDRIVFVGEGVAGQLALQVASHNPELASLGVIASGPGLEGAVQGTDLSGLKAYLVVNEQDTREVVGGILARNALAEDDCPVVLERYRLAKPFTKDRAVLLRALGWIQGKEVSLPGAGDAREF